MNSIWRRAPFLRLVIPLMVGVTIGFYLPHDFILFYIATAAGIFLLSLLLIFARQWKHYRYNLVFGVLTTWTFLFVGAALSLHQAIKNTLVIESSKNQEIYLAEVLEYPQKKEKSVQVVIGAVQRKSSDGISKITNAAVMAYAPIDILLDTLIPGDLIHFKGRINVHRAPINPNQFDYGKYLRKNGIVATVYLKDDVAAMRPAKTDWSFKRFFSKIQFLGIRIFEQQGLEKRELGVAAALVLGQRSLLLPDTREAFTNAGAIHVLAVSGLHVGIIYIALVGILGRVLPGKKWKLFNLIAILFCLWFYAGVTGFSPSVLRAATMFSFIAIGKHGGNRADIYNMLAASAFLLIVLNPAIISEVGFQLSYLAVTGIVFFFEPIYKIFIFNSVVLDWVWSLMVVSFSAQLATFPISIYYFGQFPNYFLLANLLVIPGAMFALWGGLILIAVHAIPILNVIAAFALKWILIILISFIEWISELPMAISHNLHFGLAAMILIYLFIIFIVKAIYNPARGNVWSPLILMLALCIMWSYRQVSIASAVSLGVVDVGSKSVIIATHGKTTFIISDDIEDESRQKAHYFLGGHLIKSGAYNLEWKHIDSAFDSINISIRPGVVFYNGFSVSSRSNWPNDIAEIDFIVVSKKMDLKQIPVYTGGATLVLDSGISDYYRGLIIQHCIKHQIPFWDMSHQGALFAERQATY